MAILRRPWRMADEREAVMLNAERRIWPVERASRFLALLRMTSCIRSGGSLTRGYFVFDGISMANKKTTPDRREAKPAEARPAAAKASETKPGHDFVMFRETLESIVVAFVLAFLFRTFEAEAFVIPTGSMSPSLQGQHKDVHCLQCGHRFRTTASSEGENRDRLMAQLRGAQGQEAVRIKAAIASLDVVGGMCPMCRYLMPMRPDLPRHGGGRSRRGRYRVPAKLSRRPDSGEQVRSRLQRAGAVGRRRLQVSRRREHELHQAAGRPAGRSSCNSIRATSSRSRSATRTRSSCIERKPVDKVDGDARARSTTPTTNRRPSTTPAGRCGGRRRRPTAGRSTPSQASRRWRSSSPIDTGKDAPMAWLRYRHQTAGRNPLANCTSSGQRRRRGSPRQRSEAVSRRMECRVPKEHPPAADRRLQLLQRPPAPRLRRTRWLADSS